MCCKNLGAVDRAFRALVGLILIGLAILNNWPWAYIGAVPLLTAFIGFCPAYTIIGLKTCRSDKA
ncbi:MAG: DUF2892 domain-containing protein [Rhodospirillales bacterium]|nr:DUF2892 domain-containing protein [Rhodospirillales bacterium]